MFKVFKQSHQPLMLSLVSAQVLNPELYFREGPGCVTVHAKADITHEHTGFLLVVLLWQIK